MYLDYFFLTLLLLLNSNISATIRLTVQDISLGNSNNINDGADIAKNKGIDDGLSQQQIETRANEALGLIRDWTLRFGGEVYRGTQETTCHRAIKDQYDPSKTDQRRAKYKASVVSIDWTRLHADIVRTISNSMGWHKNAVEAIVKASESLASNHTFDEKLRFDYVDVHRLYDIDEFIEDEQPPPYYPNDTFVPSDGLVPPDNGGTVTRADAGEHQETAQLDANGRLISDDLDSPDSPPPEPLGTPAPLVHQIQPTNGDGGASDTNTDPSAVPMQVTSGDSQEGEWQTPVKYLKLAKHPNFGDVPISTETSAVHVPVHIYPADPVVMNAIAWSEELNKVFKNNFVRNPKLNNQYFASPHGFMRLFPAQKWQIPRADPDLYDARMRPWYVAGASSRKDVVILVDSSGSMTGNRRDIAKGVIFEILDTLTDNDHFLILKFNDIIQQVGVPACRKMRVERNYTKISFKNTMFNHQYQYQVSGERQPDAGMGHLQMGGGAAAQAGGGNGTDIDSLYLLPATGRNVRYVKTNFTIATSGIANFSNALVTAFEVLKKYQDTETLGSQCNQAIMLITDGAPSDFEDIFNRYNYPNAPVRVFSYLIGREAGDPTQTKMMACNNRGFYTHVINLAEVRETVQQYIPVMARPLVLNGTHPITWTPAYGELTYQMLTDWIWEQRRRERSRSLLAGGSRQPAGGGGGGGGGGGSGRLDIQITKDDQDGQGGDLLDLNGAGAGGELLSPGYDDRELDALDIFGYNNNPDCFWETHRNDLLTTVVQPVYDQRNESKVVEKFLNKNVWVKKESIVRTANLLGIAAADMKINDIIALAPSHKLGANGYAIMLTNNGLIMHHPDLRSVLEPFSNAPSDKGARILKPFFSSLDFLQVEHILEPKSDGKFVAMRQEAVEGKTGWRELITKRTLDCQRRIQSRKQIFYYKPLDLFPFSFIIAIPQPYGSHKVEAQIEIKNSSLPEKLTTYFTTSDYDIWSVHPDYQYCDGASNNTIATLLDMFQRIEEGRLDDVQWRPAESAKPPLFSPDKIICDKSLVQSLVFDAVATYSFSENCGPPSLSADPLSLLLALLPRSSLVSMFGVRFSFVATRSGLTRVRHYNADDVIMKKEALAFAKKHARASDETYYSRTVDYNMLINDTAILIQVPFNAHQKIADRLNRFEQQAREAATSYDGSADGSGESQPGPGTRLSVADMSLSEKLEVLKNSSLHVIATQSVIANEGAQRAVAGVVGVFYDYASFVLRLLNTTDAQFADMGAQTPKRPAHCYLGDRSPGSAAAQDVECNDELKSIKCGLSNDTIDCLLIDNNGYIVVSEHLDFIGRHLSAYDSHIMARLVSIGAYHEVNVTDYQSICMRHEEKPDASSGCGPGSFGFTMFTKVARNTLVTVVHLWSVGLAIVGALMDLTRARVAGAASGQPSQQGPMMLTQSVVSLLPNKTYLRPCDRVMTRYETRPEPRVSSSSDSSVEYYTTRCKCPAWFVYKQVPKTNLIMLIVDAAPGCNRQVKCDSGEDGGQQRGGGDQDEELLSLDDSLNSRYNIIGSNEQQVCQIFERESKLYRKRLDACFSHHPEEEHTKLCGSADRSNQVSLLVWPLALLFSLRANLQTHLVPARV